VRIPATIRVGIKAGDRKMQGLFAMLTFAMARKNSFDLLFGPSNEAGEIEITREQVLEEARKSMELFVMDYADIESYWTGKLRVTPMNRDAVQRSLSAYRLFRKYEYPPGYEDKLLAADAALTRVAEVDLTAVVNCEASGPIDVETVRVPAR
jgi:hypothetical protein